MSSIHRILLHAAAFYILVNGGLLVADWIVDTNTYKDSFPLLTGILSIVFGLIAFVVSFLKFEKKEK